MAPEPAGARRNAARAPVDTDQLLPLTVEVAHAFGSHCGRGFHDAVLFGDIAGQYLVHPVGRYMAFRHLVGGEASYTVESDKVQAVTACAVSRDRSLLVTCEICSLPAPHSQVSIYNLGTSASTRPTQTLEELGEGVGRIVAAAFSAATDQDAASSLLCLASEGPPEPQILVLDWHLNQVLGRFSLSSAVSRVAFSPASSGIVSASGPECLNLWVLRDRPQETQQEPEGSQELPVEVLGKKELCKLSEVSSFKGVPLTFTDHAWLEPANGNLVVCTEEGPVHIVRIEVVADVSDGAADPTPYLLCTIELPFGSLLETASLCVRCIANGFMVGGGSGALALWSLSAPGPGLQALHGEDYGEDSDEVYDEDESPAPVYCLDTCVRVTGAAGHGSALLCLDVVGDSDEAQILLGFQSADITCLSLSELRAAAPVGEVVGCSPISGGFHSGPITSLDMAVQRPILVSACKEDSTVRVWDYQAGHCDLRTEFAGEEITGVAVHPFGFFLAISFSDRIRFMQILAKELKPFRELLVRGLRCVRFSNGGHLVAAVQSKLVVVWNTRTLKKLQTLKGHPSQVSSISFDPDDKLLMTCGEDGSLCEWSTLSWTKVHEQPSRGEASAAAAGRDGFGWAGIVEGGNSAFRSFRRCNAREDEDIVLPTGTRLCAMSYHSSGTETANSEDYVLAGDSWGALRTFCSLSAIMRIKEHGLHSAACTAVCVSTDSRTVATAGEDGAIFVLRVDGLVTPTAASSAVGSARAGRNGGGSMEVVMINRGEIQQRQDEIEELTNETGGLKAQLEEDAARLQNECRVRVDEARRKDQEQVQSLRLKCEALQQASTAKERENLRQMKAMEASHLQAADELEKVYDKKVRSDADSYSSLEVELRELGVKLEQARETAQRTLEQQRAKQEQEIARQAAEKDAEIKKIKDLMAFTQHRFDAMLDQEGGEQDMEMTDIKRRSQEELEQQHLVEYKLKKEQDTLLRGLDMIEKDRERIATEQREAPLHFFAFEGVDELA
ncbi:unnamed protein product [Polarella glacialis]|uniref:Cilia- and flagella-associated protein 57 n=1 Tax=Polarella glacialis TaxID=89957 RepID=A0A813GX59_POLGL|nr:unnamed protein product [Polarella glacialis]